MAVNWDLYDYARNGKGLKLKTGYDGFLFLEEDGGMCKVLEVIDLERTPEWEAVDKLNGLGFGIVIK